MVAGTISYAETSLTKTVGDAVFTNALAKTGDGSVTYAISSNSGVASIDSGTGQVTIGSNAGEVTVTATVSDSSNYHYATTAATYTLRVLAKPSPDANVAPGNWGTDDSVTVTPDKDGL